MKKLYKSYTDKKLCGVCGGIAQILEIDATIVRVIWAISTIFFGVSIFLYFLCALILPNNDTEVITHPKKLYRSRTDKKICGVCGGIAEYFNIDSSILRILFIIFFCIFGSGLLAYLVLALIIPKTHEEY